MELAEKLPNNENEQLAEKYGEYVNSIVRNVMLRYGIPMKIYREYLGAAYTGLIEAASRFDETSGIPFERYAYLRIRGAIIDHIREGCLETPRAAKAAKLIRASDCIAEDFNSIKNHINPKNVDEALAEALDYAARGALIFRLNYANNEENILKEKDISEDFEGRYNGKKIQEKLYIAISDLPPREKEVIIMYYFHDMTFQDIANELKVSRSWISRMHARSIRVLRMLLENRIEREEW